ncbi:MAG: hypothetical protein H0U70_02915 [Tatlockia sp.]|nr:hypothetical protein [Tatlockia sp.]
MSKFNITKDIFELLKLEAKLTAMNIPGLLLNLSLLIVLLLTIWVILMILLGDLILIFIPQPFVAICFVLFFNLILMIFLLRNLKVRLKEMSFSRTRDCMANSQEGNQSESKEKRTSTVNYEAGSKHKLQKRNGKIS